MNWLRKIMIGRYGGDQLSMTLLILSIILTLVGSITSISVFTILGYLPLIVSIFRMFSKDIQKRRAENYKFAMFMSPVYSWFNKAKLRAKDLKHHRYYKCPNCKAFLRVPKGKGKISITCPKCRTEFIKKT